MAWSIVGVGTVAEATATPLTLTEPAGVADGDLLVCCIASRSTATTAVTNTGWTAVNSQNTNNTLITTSAIGSGTMLYRVRSGTSDLTFDLPAGISVARGQIVAYRGNSTTTPLDVSAAATTAINTLSVSVTGLTTTQDDDLIVAMCAGGQEAVWSSFNATTPSGASGATDTTTAPSATWRQRAASVTTTGADTSIGIYDALKTTAGATGNLTATASLGAGHVVIAGAFKIRPPSLADAWNIGDKSFSFALSNSDKTVTSTVNSVSGIRSTQVYANGTAGKYYAEFLVDTYINSTEIGMLLTSSGLTATTGWRVLLNSGDIRNSGTVVGSVGSALASSDVLCMAWDAGAKVVWFRKNGGNWNNNAAADPAAGTNSIAVTGSAGNYALHMLVSLTGGVVTVRTELAEFTQTVPSGFTSWMGETAGGGSVSVPVTGVEATGAVGLVTVATVASVSVPVTGVEATGQIGTVTVTISTPVSVPVTGVEATGAVDSVSAVGKANVSTTGVAAAGSVNAVTITGKANVPATGVEATGSVGTASAVVTATPAVTGVEATGAVGTATVVGNANVSATGVAALGKVGDVTVSTVSRVDVSTAVTGVEATGSVNGVTVIGKASVTAVGVQGTGSVGTVTATAGTGVSTPVTGVGASASVDGVIVVGKAVVSATGVQASGSVGTVTATGRTGITVAVTSVTATGSVDQVTIVGKANVPATGVTATSGLGNVSVTAGGSISAGATGVTATGSVGSVIVVLRGDAAVTGVSAAGSVGSASIIGKANAPLTGVQGAGAIGSVSVVAGASEAVADAWDWTRTTGPVTLSNGDKTATAEAA